MVKRAKLKISYIETLRVRIPPPAPQTPLSVSSSMTAGTIKKIEVEMAKDWKVVIDDTGGPYTGWPSVSSESEDRTILHRAGFIQEFWHGPSLKEALEISRIVADYLNNKT